MFGWWPRLLVDFVFPTIGSNEAPMREASARSVDVYVASVRDWLRSTLWEAQAQSTMKACQQKQYYDRKIGTMNLKPGDLVLVKADAWKGKRKIKDRWDEETWEVSWQIAWLMWPPTKWWTNTDGHKSSTETGFFSLHQRLVFPCVWATIIHGTGVPVPPHARLPPQEVMKRGCHKRKMARQSPDMTYQ